MTGVSLRDTAIGWAKALLPPGLRAWVVTQQRKRRLQWPRAGSVNFGDFRRVTPISPIFSMDRGTVIDRYYIESFLKQNAGDIRGRALELGDAFYINKLGTAV